MESAIFKRALAVLLTVAVLVSLAVFTASEEPAATDDKFADGAFKVLFIGNSASDDATDCGYQKDSKLYEIMKSMVGDGVKVEVGLCWSGGKSLAWHATVAETDSGEYTFMYHPDGGEWEILSAPSSAHALRYTDWDAVVLQPWGLEVTRGKATYGNGESKDFVDLENSVSYMLDHVATYAPCADIYYYHIWATTHDYQNFDAERANYEKICKYTRLAETCRGKTTGAAFKGVVPAGATVQALRGTYLGLLDVNTDKTVIDHTTDPQMGIQRDAVHMSFCIGRYAVGLTFAEAFIPEEKRADGYALPPLRTSQIAGELPDDYLKLIRLAVDAAYESAAASGDDRYNVAPLEGYADSPIHIAKAEMESHTYTFGAVPTKEKLKKLWEENIGQGTSLDIAADITIEGDYSPPAAGETAEVTAKVTYRHGYLTGGEASVKAKIFSGVTLSVIAGEGGTVSPSGESVVAVGSTVTVTAKPDFGCKVSSICVNGKSVGTGNTCVIENITEDTAVVVTFEKIILPFADVKEKHWFYNDVMFVYAAGLMNGSASDRFEPNADMNRAMLVTVIWRMEGSPKPVGKTPFTDLKQGLYCDAVAWAYENGIVKGMTETEFDPAGKVIREQLAAIFYRYAAYKGIDVSEKADISGYPDIDRVRAYAKDAMAWANGAGLIIGKAEGSAVILDPRTSATRAQAAALLNRFCAKY